MAYQDKNKAGADIVHMAYQDKNKAGADIVHMANQDKNKHFHLLKNKIYKKMATGSMCCLQWWWNSFPHCVLTIIIMCESYTVITIIFFSELLFDQILFNQMLE